MASGRRSIIDVVPATALAERARLLEALSMAFPVSFRAGWGATRPDHHPADATIVFARPGEPAPTTVEPGGPPLFVAAGHDGGEGERETVVLCDDPGVDQRLRGISLQDRLIAPATATAAISPGEVLARAGSGPAWTVSRDGMVHAVRSVLSELAPDDVLWSMLSRRPLGLVALVQFLRSVTRSSRSSAPPLRATFMFDDPNLRWRSYGFIDYRRLLAHADAHGYHAAMATIPLDCGSAHRSTAELFARRSDRLSLLVHGNDHVKEELRALGDPTRALAVAAQALRRVERLQRRCGVIVDRVMTPPHGLCSEPMTRALAAVGFDALCAEHPLPWSAHVPSGDLLAAWRPADFVGGCPVIPRQPLDSIPASIALRAFLDQPVVIYGHHRDLADGYERLEELAALVNGFGDVRWGSMGEITRSNAEVQIDGPRAIVRPLARVLRIEVPLGVGEMTVESPADLLAPDALHGFSLPDGRMRAFGEPAPVRPGSLAVRLRGATDVDPEHVSAPPWRPWPKLRRAAVEARDRGLAIAVPGIFAR